MRNRFHIVLIIMIAISAMMVREPVAQEISVADVQRILAQKGFDPGPADGLMGPRSRAAILAFQLANGLNSTGLLDEQTISALKAVSSPAVINKDAEETVKKSPQPTKRVASEATPVKILPNSEVPESTGAQKQSANGNRQTSISVEAPVLPDSNQDRSPGGSSSFWVWVIGVIIASLWFRRRRRKNASGSCDQGLPDQIDDTSNEYAGWDGLHVTVGTSSIEAVKKPTLQTQKERSQTIKWHPSDSSFTVGNFRVGGLVYTGKTERYGPNSKHIINPALRVSATPLPYSERALPYWPDYSEISPSARATYLAWLASGRRAPEADVGYMFLFFYGLEYRFFEDRPTPQDRIDIINEVEELLVVYGPRSGSVQRYLGQFLEYAKLSHPIKETLEPVYHKDGWETPIRVRVVLGAFAQLERPISGNWMLSWFLTHPECHLRTPASRCPDEFRALFLREFDRRYPNGYAVRKPKKKLELVYRAASGEFQSSVGGQFAEIPDVSVLNKPINDMTVIADFATGRLEKYSRYLGRNPERRDSLEAQALLPIELRDTLRCDHLEALRQWASERAGSKHITFAADVIERLEGTRPQKIRRAQLVSASDALAQLGFGFAPDPRFSFRSPKADERIILFNLGREVEALEDVSNDFKSALLELALSAFIAHADDEVVEAEKRQLLQIINRRGNLETIERKRLIANLVWLINVPPDMSLLRRRIKDASPSQVASFRRALVTMAKADDIIRSSEVKRIEQIYSALGIERSLAYSDLHAGFGVDDPIPVASALAGRNGEAIPQPEDTSKYDLDLVRIDEIRRETDSVSRILSDIFNDEPSSLEVESNLALSSEEGLDGLDRDHTVLMQKLIARPTWSAGEYEALVKQQGLFPEGALETINDWAFASYGQFLLDQYGDIEVLASVAQNVRAQLEGRSIND